MGSNSLVWGKEAKIPPPAALRLSILGPEARRSLSQIDLIKVYFFREDIGLIGSHNEMILFSIIKKNPENMKLIQDPTVR